MSAPCIDEPHRGARPTAAPCRWDRGRIPLYASAPMPRGGGRERLRACGISPTYSQPQRPGGAGTPPRGEVKLARDEVDVAHRARWVFAADPRPRAGLRAGPGADPARRAPGRRSQSPTVVLVCATTAAGGCAAGSRMNAVRVRFVGSVAGVKSASRAGSIPSLGPRRLRRAGASLFGASRATDGPCADQCDRWAGRRLADSASRAGERDRVPGSGARHPTSLIPWSPGPSRVAGAGRCACRRRRRRGRSPPAARPTHQVAPTRAGTRSGADATAGRPAQHVGSVPRGRSWQARIAARHPSGSDATRVPRRDVGRPVSGGGSGWARVPRAGWAAGSSRSTRRRSSPTAIARPPASREPQRERSRGGSRPPARRARRSGRDRTR